MNWARIENLKPITLRDFKKIEQKFRRNSRAMVKGVKA